VPLAVSPGGLFATGWGATLPQGFLSTAAYTRVLVLTRLGGRLNTEAPRLREWSPRAENHDPVPGGVPR
jgi:hypothetical protein